MEGKRILIVEDNQEIATLLDLHLSDMGAEVVMAADGHDGMHQALTNDFDLLILDIQLPGPSGLDICRNVRRLNDYVPILMLTSRTGELDRVMGLDLGADDYLSKPFSVMELLARVKAIFRRIASIREAPPAEGKPLCIRGLTIDEGKRKVTLNNRELDLTAREFDLLCHFAAQPGRVFRRSELLDHVWGYGHDGYEHTVNSHINRLRAKIEEDPHTPRIIATVWGVGYKLDSAKVPA